MQQLFNDFINLKLYACALHLYNVNCSCNILSIRHFHVFGLWEVNIYRNCMLVDYLSLCNLPFTNINFNAYRHIFYGTNYVLSY